jgi:hypothetical protein
VLIVGGSGFGQARQSVEIYDPELEKFNSTESLEVGRFLHTATLLADGRVVIIGGQETIDVFDSVEIYDPKTSKWAAGAPMELQRSQHTATLLQNG